MCIIVRPLLSSGDKKKLSPAHFTQKSRSVIKLVSRDLHFRIFNMATCSVSIGVKTDRVEMSISPATDNIKTKQVKTASSGKYEIIVQEKKGFFSAAVPDRLPVGVAIICCILNCILPGIGKPKQLGTCKYLVCILDQNCSNNTLFSTPLAESLPSHHLVEDQFYR